MLMLTLTLTFYSRGEEKGGKYSEKENIFFLEEKKNREKEKEENIWRRSLQKLSRILRGLGFGLDRETFANLWRVSVSENLVLEKSLGFDFGKFGFGKKVSVLVSENLISEKKYRFGKLGLGKKSSFRFWKTWCRKKSRFHKTRYWKKKSWYQLRSKFLYRHSVRSTPLKPKFGQANKLQRAGRNKWGKGTSNTWVKEHLLLR